MRRIFPVIALLLSSFISTPGIASSGVENQQFSLLVYNIENLFDLDGISVFDEYKQDDSISFPYSARRFLTKINNHAEVIRSYGDGAGPDIIAFQEFEADFSQDTNYTLEELLDRYKNRSVESILMGDLTEEELRFPPEFYLMKRLEELGLGKYHFYTPKHEDSWFERGIAQRSVYLSRFPATALRQHRLDQARDIFEVSFDVHGNELIIFNNHWKSGASSSRSEPTRIENAKVLRSLLDVRMAKNPEADVILVGDFNSHHNQVTRMKDVDLTALNGILKSQSSELALVDGSADLYNLWYELPQQQRGSEVWNGQWGTLMQIIVSRGLYDGKGITYVDQSFGVHRVSGLNFDERTGTPISWVNLASGKGCSDHLPVYAEFQFEGDAPVCIPEKEVLGSEEEIEHTPIYVNKSSVKPNVRKDLSVFRNLEEDTALNLLGELFWVKAQKSGRGIRLADTDYGIYSGVRAVRDAFEQVKEGDPVEFVGKFGIYRGNLQFVIEEYDWYKSL